MQQEPSSNNETLTYKSALEELENIAKEIDSEDVDIDTLATKIKRAEYLQHHCRNKLTGVETEVKTIIERMEMEF